MAWAASGFNFRPLTVSEGAVSYFQDHGVVGQRDEQRRTNRLVWAVVIGAALIAATAAGVAKGFESGWPVLAAVVIGAVTWPIGNAVKAQLEQRQKNVTTRRALTAGSADMRRVRDTTPADVRVHRAVRTDVPYIERDLEPQVIDALRFDRRVVIVGPAGVGKTRLHCPAPNVLPGISSSMSRPMARACISCSPMVRPLTTRWCGWTILNALSRVLACPIRIL
jgi:hypothetical protein